MNMPSRRRWAARISAGILFAGLAWVGKTQDKPQKLMIHEIKKDLYELEGDDTPADAGNVLVYVTDEGVILIDDRYDWDHDNVVNEVKRLTPQPIKYILNTHYHDDHSGGNARMLPLGISVISTARSRRNILEHKQPGVSGIAPANIVFTDETSVFLGGKEVRAKFFGRGHTGGDAIIYFPGAKVIHTGDLMRDKTPLIDYAGGGSLAAWPNTLDAAMRDLDFDTVVPGHGPVTSRAGLRAYRDNIAQMRTDVSAMVKSGKTQAEISKFMEAKQGWKPNGIEERWSAPGFMTEFK